MLITDLQNQIRAADDEGFPHTINSHRRAARRIFIGEKLFNRLTSVTYQEKKDEGWKPPPLAMILRKQHPRVLELEAAGGRQRRKSLAS